MAKIGRPPKFSSPEKMQAKIEEYFNDLPTKAITVGGEVIEIPVATITGLALHLGFESRQSMYDYEKNGEFSYTIKRARLRIENDYEMQLRTSTSPTGAIFGLKNLGWSDKQELEHTSPDGSMSPRGLKDFYSDVNGGK